MTTLEDPIAAPRAAPAEEHIDQRGPKPRRQAAVVARPSRRRRRLWRKRRAAQPSDDTPNVRRELLMSPYTVAVTDLFGDRPSR